MKKKQGNKDRAASRTQDIRNQETVNRIEVIEDKIKDVKINEFKENDFHNYDYDYDLSDDYSDEEYSDADTESSEDISKPEYYYYYYYDYLDSGIDISHELSNSEAAQYEPSPTPLWQVSGHTSHSQDSQKEEHDETAVTT